MQVLDISDAVIANGIIDQRRVEFVLLCEDKNEARSFMQQNSKAQDRDAVKGSPPAQYNEMFAMNGDQFYSKPCFR